MEHERPIHYGNLFVPGAGKILSKKSWHQKHCLLFKFSKLGVERLELYDGTDTTKQLYKIIYLRDTKKISQKTQTCFIITTKSCNHEFEVASSGLMKEWLSSLQSVCFPDDSSKITSVEEDNDLYCPSGEGIFNVKLHSSPASTRCGLEAKQYLLVLTNNNVQLRNCHDNKLLYTWPYCFIRRYGYKNGMFTFEAGRKCESGEGIFYLQHSDQQEIFRCFSSKIKSMKKLLSNETFPTLFEMDSSLHPALSMEARSRSPIPYSLSTSTSIHDIEPQVSDMLVNKVQSVGRPIPVKPPRKNIPPKDDGSKEIYETVNKYDEIEYKSEAWRTMGLNEVDHQEASEPEEEYMSWGTIKKGPIKGIVPKVNLEPQSKEDYDKLNFFGTKSKYNNSSYKQVKVTSNDPPSFNEYDEILVAPTAKGIAYNNADKQIPKNFVPSKHLNKSKDSQISHQFHNDEPYAIISKPKQV